MASQIKSQEGILTLEDLFKFEESFKPLFRRALNAGRVDLMAPPKADSFSLDPLARACAKGKAVYDEKGARLVVPLIDQGKVLACVVIWQVTAEQLHPAVSGFLAALMEGALQMVRLRIAAGTDPITGLANEHTLDEALTTALSGLSPFRVRDMPAIDQEQGESGYCLLALELSGIIDLRERYGRIFGDKVIKASARKIKETVPDAICLARASDVCFVLLKGGESTARAASMLLQRAVESLELTTPQHKPWFPCLRMGAALIDVGSWQEGGLAMEAAAVLKGQALRALLKAGKLDRSKILFFNEIVEKGGRLVEILPVNRVLVDLGRIHGLTDGERFKVIPAGNSVKKETVSEKAEIVIISLGVSESIAEITKLLDPSFSLRPGDSLRRLGPLALPSTEDKDFTEITFVGHKVKVLLDKVTSLPSHRSFLALFRVLCESRKVFSVALLQIEGLEGIREVLGVVGADSLVKNLAKRLRKKVPNNASLGRFAPDTLGILFPSKEPLEAKEILEKILEQIKHEIERPLRAGVGFQPCSGFEPTNVLDNAYKALIHASFLEPYSVVVFDAVSLNISGDRLFSQGRMTEAVVEYEKALVIEPLEVNVLNSLGVCYGHLGQPYKAMECFEKALLASPKDYMAYYNLGYAYMSQGKLEKAWEKLSKSLELKPGHADTLFQLGCLAKLQGRLPEALEYLSKASENPNCRRVVHRRLGEALASAGRFHEAEESFNKAVKANSNDASALASLAGLYLDRKANYEIALSLARRARDLEPNSVRYVRVMARALVRLKHLEEAQSLLSQATRDFPKDPFVAVQKGGVEAALGNEETAIEDYKRALLLEPQLESAHKGLAELNLKTKK